MRSKIFIINLADSHARLAHCRQQLADIQFERIEAVNGRNLNAQQIAQHYDEKHNPVRYHKPLTVGEVGCYLSHRKVWQRIIDEQLDYAIVLEDDFVLNQPIDGISQALEAISEPWDYIKLAEYPNKRKAIHSASCGAYELVVYNKVPARTCAQVVSLQGAKKLLAASQRFSRPVDIDIQYWWEMGIVVYGLKPYIFKPNLSVYSEIDGLRHRKQSHRRLLGRIFQQIRFLLNNRKALRRLLRQNPLSLD